MTIRSFPLIIVWGIVAVTLSPNPRSSRGATVCDSPIATMASVQGSVEVRRVGQSQSQPARLNDTYCIGDRIQVGDNSRADIALVNQPVLRLDQNTLITLEGMKAEGASVIAMARGALHFFSRLPRNLEVNTAFVNAGVEGTEGLIEAQADQTAITIFDGKVLAANPAGRLRLTSGQSARGRTPEWHNNIRIRWDGSAYRDTPNVQNKHSHKWKMSTEVHEEIPVITPHHYLAETCGSTHTDIAHFQEEEWMHRGPKSAHSGRVDPGQPAA